MEDKLKVKTVTIVVGCLFFVCVIVFAFLIGLTAIYRQDIPAIKNYFPTLTPTLTPTPTPTPIPRILVHLPPNDLPVLKEDFTTNQNDWSSYYFYSKVEVKNGKLLVEAFDSHIGIGYCFCKSPFDQPLADNYYFQADISTSSLTRELYGLAFGLDDDNFYIFTINQHVGAFFLDKKTKDGWISLFSARSTIIKPYPGTNTLSIYFDHGTIDLYINGQPVTTYEDKEPFNKGKIGIYTNDSGFQVIVDNVFAYNEK